MKTITYITIMLILAISVNAIEVYDKECKNDGSIRLLLKADSKSTVYMTDVKVMYGQEEMKGDWDNQYITKSDTAKREYAEFQSYGSYLKEKKTYRINIEYQETGEDGEKTSRTDTLEIGCPGLVFSCNGLGIKIESCTNSDELFRAVITAKGLEQSQEAKMDVKTAVDFLLEAENKYKDITGKEGSRGAVPEKAQVISPEKDKYVLRYEWEGSNNIKTMRVGYNEDLTARCKPEEYPEIKFYDRMDCTTEETTIKEEKKEETPIATQAVKETKQEPAQKTKTADDILQEQPKNYRPLAIVSMILVGVLGFGGIILSYLYRRGYI
ncbi:MAG: hypothetical protein V1645_02900 [archaeon]